MATFSSQITILVFLLLSSITFHTSMSSNHNLPRCNEKDREALLIFRKGIIDPYDLLSTWRTEEDCCAWKGVSCNNISGRVTMLDLNSENNWNEKLEFQRLNGEINFAFLELEFLHYLDLSNNLFDVISSPPIQHNITHPSNLYHLDLSWNSDLHMNDFHFHWISQLSSLKYLALSGIDLSLNNFNSELPSGFFNFTRDISHLHLYGCNIHGQIPSILLNLRHLRHLDISYNMFSGSIPSSLGNLSSLVYLAIGSNYFSGEISEATLSKLSHLKFLDMSHITVAFRFGPQWVPPFQLTELYLTNINQGPTFPLWIYTQKSLQSLELSSSRISFNDLNKVMSFVEGISYILGLSNNSIQGDISNVTFKASMIYLDHNNFSGSLPHISPMTKFVDFSYNSFSGSIPHSWKNLSHIDLSSNRLFGNVLRQFSGMKSLRFMNLGKNKFSGTIPINVPQNLRFLNLGENKFSGTIPINVPQNLQVIILRSNQFEGNIPPQLFNLSSLFYLDLAHNKLNGSMPKGIYSMTQMIISKVNYSLGGTVDWFTKGQDYQLPLVDPNRRTIDLSGNNLSGEVPLELFQLIQVQTLNLSHNNFSGRIPDMIGRMRNMESLDLSNNKFSGRIPQNLTLLHFLGYLNLSCNKPTT